MNTDKALKTVTKGAGIVFVGIIFGRGIGYFYRMLVARYLGPFDYGLLSLGLDVLNILAPIAILGLPVGITRYVAFYKGKQDLQRIKGVFVTSYKIILISGLSFAITLFLLSDWISSTIFKTIELSLILKIFAIGAPFSILTTITVAGICSFKQMKYKVYVNDIFQKLFILTGIILSIFLGFGIIGVTLTYTVGFIGAFLLAFYFLETKLFPLIKSKVKAISISKELLSFSGPLMFAAILWVIMGRIDTLMLGYFINPVQVGIYHAAFPTAILLLVVLTSTEMIFMPVAAELYAKNLLEELWSIFRVVTKWMFAISLPIFLIMIFFSETILRILFGAEYTSGAIVLSILAVGYFIASLVGPTGAMLLTIGKTKILLANNIIVLGIDIILNLYLIPIYGIIGAAIATAISISLWNVLTLVEIYHYTRIQPFNLVFVKPAISATISILLIYLLAKKVAISSILFLALLFFIFMILYFLLLLLSRSFEREDIMILTTLEKRLGLELKLLRRLFRRFL